MAQKRDNGTGTIYQRANKTWIGKLYLGRDETGKEKFKYISGKTEGEVKKKIREFNRGQNSVDVKKICLQDYINSWLVTYKLNTIKLSSYDALEKTVRNYVNPNVGMIQLQQFSSDNAQKLLSDLKAKGYSFSTIKKVFDCLNAVFRHAAASDDVAKNPMLLVNMLAKSEFETKEIRYFTKEECALIVEECAREYRTGTPVYQYADAYILMMNTGIRLGEAIGLKKSDWNEIENTIHIRRNIQSISKRDASGNRVKGKQLVTNTTKTYSGDRFITLNVTASEAIKRLCAAHPEAEEIVCSGQGKMIPPERLERTFYRILKNVGIDQAGLHSLRHTFASMLFANNVDIKTISELLGHATVQITMNTYVHLIGEPKYSAVAKLDSI